MSGAFLSFVALCLISVARTAPQNFKEAKMPKACEGKGYCYQKSEDYPQKLIDNILNDLDRKLVQGDFDNRIEDRNSFGNPEDDCEREYNFAPIYEIIDNDGLVRFVIQSEENFQQQIRTEACVNPGRLNTSKFFEEDQLNRLFVTCSEKRIDYWFQVLSLDGNSLETVKVKGGLPVCCSCRLVPS